MKMIKLSFCLFSVLLLFSSCGNPSDPNDWNGALYAITFHIGDNSSGAPPTGMIYLITEEDRDLDFVYISTCNLSMDGYYLYAWNTEDDGSGYFIPKDGITHEQAFMYNYLVNEKELINLYPVWIKNDLTLFINPNNDGTASIELSIANEETIMVPGIIDGYTITSIGERFSWFQGSAVRTIVFPDSVTDIASGAL